MSTRAFYAFLAVICFFGLIAAAGAFVGNDAAIKVGGGGAFGMGFIFFMCLADL